MIECDTLHRIDFMRRLCVGHSGHLHQTQNQHHEANDERGDKLTIERVQTESRISAAGHSGIRKVDKRSLTKLSKIARYSASVAVAATFPVLHDLRTRVSDERTRVGKGLTWRGDARRYCELISSLIRERDRRAFSKTASAQRISTCKGKTLYDGRTSGGEVSTSSARSP